MIDIVDLLRRSTVQVVNGRGGGAGVVWSPGGMVVTNAHVLRGKTARVADADGHVSAARVLTCDPERDLALIETDLPLTPVKIGDSFAIRPGQIVLAVGNPLGLTGAVTMGTIHSVGHFSSGRRRNWIQADVHLSPGNSGGPLANAEGEVIGINTMIYNGLGFAIPSNEVAAFVRNARRNGEARAA